ASALTADIERLLALPAARRCRLHVDGTTRSAIRLSSVGSGITEELRNGISQPRNKLDATRRELANLQDEIGSIRREIRRFRAVEQAIGVERDPNVWRNSAAREQTRNARCQDNAVGTFEYCVTTKPVGLR